VPALLLAASARRLPAAVPVALLAFAVSAQAAAGVPRQREWKSVVTLWEAERARNPDAWTARSNLAGAYGAEGRWVDAPLVVVPHAAAPVSLGRHEEALEATGTDAVPAHARWMLEAIRQAAFEGLSQQ